MEGDAGASRLNPTEGQERSDPGDVTEGQERSDPGNVTEGQERSDPESEPIQEPPVAAVISSESEDGSEDLLVEDADVEARRAERFGRGWLVGICVVLLVLTIGVAAGGYLALRSHDQSETMARADSLALQRAEECVTATQAPDITVLTASQTKIIECATGAFAVQANLFTSILVEAYQVANVAVQVSELRGAIEKHNDDGSVDVLVAVRVKVTNAQAAGQETGYRLRVKMALADGTYKIADLQQVTS